MSTVDSDTSMSSSSVRSHLGNLDRYLKTDPENDTLLMDAFAVALGLSEWDCAADYLRRGQSLQSQPLQWALRSTELSLAQKQWAKARAELLSLADLPNVPPGFGLTVAHNLGLVAIVEGDFARCVSHLASYLEAGMEASPVPSAATQQLWLRALHRTGELGRACQWALKVEATHGLSPQVASVASLIALDASEIASAQRWSTLALQQLTDQDRPLEALVTKASLALAVNNAADGQKFVLAALKISPSDGRAWSVQAFVQLLTGQFVLARQSFANALATMPQHIGTWHGQGWTEIQLGDLDAALVSFETALALDRNFAESHGGLAVVFALQGNTLQANEQIELAERLDRSNVTGRYARSILSGEAKDAEAMQRLAQRLLSAKPALFGGSIADLVKR